MSEPLMPTPNPFSYTATAQSVHSTLDDAMAAIPTGKTGVLLAKASDSTATGGSADFTVAMKIGDRWKIAAGADWEERGNSSVQFAVMDSW